MELRQPAILVLQDGTVFQGSATGKIGTTTGEIAFNTGMTGYQEVFTDPSYLGQILVMATSHIGNYGVNLIEKESDHLKISGLVTKKFAENYSRVQSNMSLESYMQEAGCVGISDIDTRALVRHIRSKGAMNAIISSEILNVNELKEMLSNVPSMEGLELSSKVSTKEIYTLIAKSEKKFHVGLLDFGVKQSIINCLLERNCDVTVLPMNTKFEEIQRLNFDGIMLSNGPGDPSVMHDQIELVRQLVESDKVIFGICLGHQILGLSQGLKTEKMFNGHRGVNHPIKNLMTGKGEITSQNHGFVISKDSVTSIDSVEVTHIHLNDNTIAGIRLKDKSIFSVQYHPEASAGPHDSRYLFDDFIELMHKRK